MNPKRRIAAGGRFVAGLAGGGEDGRASPRGRAGLATACGLVPAVVHVPLRLAGVFCGDCCQCCRSKVVPTRAKAAQGRRGPNARERFGE
jgi:hypothetical protein